MFPQTYYRFKEGADESEIYRHWEPSYKDWKQMRKQDALEKKFKEKHIKLIKEQAAEYDHLNAEWDRLHPPTYNEALSLAIMACRLK